MSNANATAFPQPQTSLVKPLNEGYQLTEHLVSAGLTKRELFAAMAMNGCMSLQLSEDEESARSQMRRIASDCVFAADALFAELAKTEGSGG